MSVSKVGDPGSCSSDETCIGRADLSHDPFSFSFRLDWSGRAVSFSHDGRLLACGSEDLVIDIGDVESGRRVAELKNEAATFSLAWHPKAYLLAFSCDDKLSSTYGRPEREAGTVKIYGLTADQV